MISGRKIVKMRFTTLLVKTLFTSMLYSGTAMLEGANYRTPTGLFVNGFLTVNGQKCLSLAVLSLKPRRTYNI